MLRVENLSKKFGDFYALKDINFQMNKGEIHGLVGANGSGKSTFLNILFGDMNIQNTGGYSADIWVDNKKVDIKSTKDAINLGIGKVYQEFALIGDIDVSSNIKINNEKVYKYTEKISKDFAYINSKKNHEEAKRLLEGFGLKIDTKSFTKDLSVNIKQFIEIAREVDKKNLKLLLLDEPTACLNKEDVNIFMKIIDKLKEKGVSIIFISHRLDEIMHLCDNITVFRDGCIVSKYSNKEFDTEKIAIDMIGKKVNKTTKSDEHRYIDYSNNEKILSFKHVNMFDNNKKFENINVDIYKGEILGITSLAGHGHTILGNSIMGIYKTKGEVIYKDSKIDLNTPYKTIKKGIVLIPDERKEMGVLLDSSVSDNIIFTACYSKNKFLKHPKLKGLSMLNKPYINTYVESCIDKFNIKCSSKKQSVRELSGGNQQKICMARALSTKPELLFIGEPTRGIDIYSKEIILKMLLDVNKKDNTTIVIASSEIDELKRVCDRIIVMYEGAIFEELSPTEDDEVFSLAISGKRRITDEKN